MSKQEVFNSSTFGPIPLSFTGRRLLANLRSVFEEYVKTFGDNNGAGVASAWEPVSRARGEIAKYISELEAKNYRFKEWLNVDYGKFGLAGHVGSIQRNPFEVTLEYTTPQPPAIHNHLPAIPEGYELAIVANLVSISPIDKVGSEAAKENAETLESIRVHIQQLDGGSIGKDLLIHRIKELLKLL